MRHDQPAVRLLLIMVTYNSGPSMAPVTNTLHQWLSQSKSNHATIIENSGDSELVTSLAHALDRFHDRVAVRLAERNLGFAPAVNLALSSGRARWGPFAAVLLLNPDVMTDSKTISNVLSRAEEPLIGIAGPLLVDQKGNADRGNARRLWNKRRLFAEVVGRPALAACMGAEVRNIDVHPGIGDVAVDITSGAFLAVRGEVLGEGLDERLPMYLEDQEICHRARALGFSVIVDTSLQALHVGGVSRRSVSSRARSLRMLELAEAPARALIDESGASELSVKTTVLVGGIFRLCIGMGIWIGSLGHSERREWAREQVSLGLWFIQWAGGALNPLTRLLD